MDINRWLRQTEALAKQPDACTESTDVTQNTGLYQSKPSHHKTKQTKHKRKHESSILSDTIEAAPNRNDRRHVGHRARSPVYVLTAQSSSSISSSSSNSSSSSSASSHDKDQGRSFERRKRHKTRTAIYEPYSGERSKRTKRKVETKPDKKWKRHHKTEKPKKKKSRPGHGLVNSFRAANVPTIRLTVRLHCRHFPHVASIADAAFRSVTDPAKFGPLHQRPCFVTCPRSWL